MRIAWYLQLNRRGRYLRRKINKLHPSGWDMLVIEFAREQALWALQRNLKAAK